MREAIGIDLYNQSVTGKVTKTLNAIKSDADHVPRVLILNSSGGGIAGTIDSSYYKGQGERQGIEREFVVMADGNTLPSKRRNDSEG